MQQCNMKNVYYKINFLKLCIPKFLYEICKLYLLPIFFVINI